MSTTFSVIDDVPELEDEPVEADVVEPEVADAEVIPAAAAPVKKAIGIKEIPPFKFKLVGTSGDLRVTLFKNAEREEVDAQYERLAKEGYYTDLVILDIDAKVEQLKPPPSAKTKSAAVKKSVPAPVVEAPKPKPAPVKEKAAVPAPVVEKPKDKPKDKIVPKKPEAAKAAKPAKVAKKPAAKAEKAEKPKSKAKPAARKAVKK